MYARLYEILPKSKILGRQACALQCRVPAEHTLPHLRDTAIGRGQSNILLSL